jgi:hypothetical protein
MRTGIFIDLKVACRQNTTELIPNFIQQNQISLGFYFDTMRFSRPEIQASITA